MSLSGIKRAAVCALTAPILCFVGATGAQQRSAPTVDSYKLQYISGAGNYDTKGVALSSSGQTVNPAIKNGIMLLFGQSNCADVLPAGYSPANPTKIDQLSIYDSAIRVATNPLIGTSYPRNADGSVIYGPGNAYLQVADELITNGKFDRVIIVPACVGSTSHADWATGAQNDVIPVTMRQLAAHGIAAGTNVTIWAVWSDGETDTQNGTSQASVTASLNTIIAASRTAGFTGRWFINVQSYNAGVTSANVTNAQGAVVDHPNGIWAGANVDSLVGSVCVGAAACRQGDLTHLSTAGGGSLSPLQRTAFAASGAPF